MSNYNDYIDKKGYTHNTVQDRIASDQRIIFEEQRLFELKQANERRESKKLAKNPSAIDRFAAYTVGIFLLIFLGTLIPISIWGSILFFILIIGVLAYLIFVKILPYIFSFLPSKLIIGIAILGITLVPWYLIKVNPFEAIKEDFFRLKNRNIAQQQAMHFPISNNGGKAIIYNMQGEKMKEQTFKMINQNTVIDTTNLVAGKYNVVIVTPSNNYHYTFEK